MDGGKCILQLRGVRPFLSDKYDITKHPNYKYLSDFDKKNAFDVERYITQAQTEAVIQKSFRWILRDLRRDTKFLQGEKKMNFVNSMAFTAITFVAFTALVALISWWKTRGDNLDTQDGYYLGGRSLTGPVIAGSLLMTNLSAEQLVGNNGQAVRVGMSTMGWEVTSAIALVILAFVLMPK